MATPLEAALAGETELLDMLSHLLAHMRVRAMFGADEEMQVHDPPDWPKARSRATPAITRLCEPASLGPGGVRNEIGRLAAPFASIGLAVSDPLRAQGAQGTGPSDCAVSGGGFRLRIVPGPGLAVR